MKELSVLPDGFSFDRTKKEDDDGKPFQDLVESFMHEVVYMGNYESAYLFDSDGLLMAKSISSRIKTRVQAMEVSVLMNKFKKVIRTISDLTGVREVVIEDDKRRKVVIRFIEFLGATTILVVVVPPRKPYRGITNRLESLIFKYDKAIESLKF